MYSAALYGASGRHQRLGDDLTPEGSVARVFGVTTSIHIVFDELEVQ